MALLCILGALLIISIIIKKKTNYFNMYEDLVILVGFVGGCFVASLIAVPVNHTFEHSNIAQYHSVKATIEQARTSESIEKAALALKIAETNEWLARVQYWNETTWGIYVPDEVMELEFLR